MDKANLQVVAKRKGFFKKRMVFEVTYGNNPRVTDYCYGLIDLAHHLEKMEVNKTDIWLLVTRYENEFYKVK